MEKIVDEIIKKYCDRLEKLRTDDTQFDKYKFKLSEDGRKDINQFRRFSIGIGLFNNLKIPNDHTIVKRLFQEERKHRDAQTENYEYETIYMYGYFLSKFGNLEDIWEFAELKFDGSMDADCGFDTGFFLTYGKENLRQYLKNSTHKLKEKVERKIFKYESNYSDEDGVIYQESQIIYFDLKKPVSEPSLFCSSFNKEDD